MSRMNFYVGTDINVEPGDVLVEVDARGRRRQHLVTDVRVVAHRVPLPRGYARKLALRLDLDVDDDRLVPPLAVHPLERFDARRR